ncbi:MULTISPECIES: UPF0058 family protein [Halorussus]|uniref:UPF0058 family protein n=1 Tax=Halorussus TaxID=1070314 RepID=UPI00209D86F2|nr:UPF0058 family protein [Halorussus vallis]USZ76046.1 UPF0058 family protein [Halorussus vallis]
MRKVELIYLHALLATVHEHLDARRDLAADSLAEYERSEVGPYQIQLPKDDHEAAIRLLAGGIAASVRDGEESDRDAELQEA